jgi:peptidoglycan/xylan/chitin deacetylase (PgdA/CDA1 family)
MSRIVHWIDRLLASFQLGVQTEKGVLLTFLFHSLFRDQLESESGLLDPQQGITVEMFREAVQHFKHLHYQFIAPHEIVRGLAPQGKYVLFTFDDGYYNNARAIPVMEEFQVPAVFFISSNHVNDSKSFWWDVIYRELKKGSCTEREIQREINSYKHLRTSQIETQLADKFGFGAFTPVGDLDRPFLPSELTTFAGHPLVSLGNHTCDHAILTNYLSTEVKDQIEGCQEAVFRWCGRRPEIISYPNGNTSEQVADAARRCGLELGISLRTGRNRLPLPSVQSMTLKRFTVWGKYEIAAQCKISRSRISLHRALNQLQVKNVSGWAN